MKQPKPLIAITLGDPCGIGPEVTFRALRDKRVKAACRPLLIGSPGPGGHHENADSLFFDLSDFAQKLGKDRQYRQGSPSKTGGLVSFLAVELGLRLALNGPAKALVTAPVSKQSWQKAGIRFTGHTEFLESACKTPRAAMCFSKGNIRCVTVTNHLPLKDISAALSAELISEKTLKFVHSLKHEGKTKPAIALCALNPHAGDAGKIGREELDIIIPAVKILRKAGVNAQGPYPADSLWERHARGEFDGIVCMYHDCALIPLKTLKGPAAVHYTAGLPVIRTSPAHGTAFDIAGQNCAAEESMIEAILHAVRQISPECHHD